MKENLSKSSTTFVEVLLKEYETHYPVPTMEDESYIMLMLAFSVAKANIYELVTYTSLPEEEEKQMIKIGVDVIKGKTTPEAYYNKFLSIIKKEFKTITIDTPDFLKTQIIARVNQSKNQIVNVNLKEENNRKSSSIGDFHEDINNANSFQELEKIKRNYGQNWFDHLPSRQRNVVAEKMMSKIHDLTVGKTLEESTIKNLKYTKPTNCVLCGSTLPKDSFSSLCSHCEATQAEEEKAYFSEATERKDLENPESNAEESNTLNQSLDKQDLEILNKHKEGKRFINNVYFLLKKYSQVLDLLSDTLKNRLQTELAKSQKLESLTLQTLLDVYTAQNSINNKVALKSIPKELIKSVTSFITELTDSINKNLDLSEVDTLKPIEEEVNQLGKGFKHTYHMGFRWWKNWKELAQRKHHLEVEFSSEDNCWLVYTANSPDNDLVEKVRPEHILTYNIKTGEVFTDLSLDDLKAFKTKPTDEVLTEVLEEAYFDIEKPLTLYHATPKKNVRSILQKGLLPSEATAKKHSKPLVWLADTQAAAIGHAKRKIRNENDLAILAVNLDPKKDKVYKALIPGIYTVEGIITPDKITEVKQNKTMNEEYPLVNNLYNENPPQDTEKAGRIEESTERLEDNQTIEVNPSTGKSTVITWEIDERVKSGWTAFGTGDDESTWSGIVFPTIYTNNPDWNTLEDVEKDIDGATDETGFRTYQNLEEPEEIDTEVKLRSGADREDLDEAIDLVKSKIMNEFHQNWSLENFLSSLKNVAIEVKSKLKNEFLVLKTKLSEVLNKIDWDDVNKNAVYNIIQTDVRGDINKAQKVIERLSYYTTKYLHEDIVNMNKSKEFEEDSAYTEHKELEPGDRVTLLNTPQIREEMKRKWGTTNYGGKEGEVVRISGLPNCVVLDIDDSGLTVDTPVNWINNNIEILEDVASGVDNPEVTIDKNGEANLNVTAETLKESYREIDYEIPNSVDELFKNGPGNSYKIIDYTRDGPGSMDNIQSMQCFLENIGATSENIDVDDGTQVVLQCPGYSFKLVIDSGGLGDFYSHGYDVSLYEK